MIALAGALILSLSLTQLAPLTAGDDAQIVDVAAKKKATRKRAPKEQSAREAPPADQAKSDPGLSLPGPLDGAFKELTADSWVGDEDLLFVFQTFCALGAASAVGAVALLPAHAVFFGALLFITAAQPNVAAGVAPLVAIPMFLIAGTLVLQAGIVGLTLWAVGLTSEHFKAPNLAPLWLQKLVGGKDASPVVTLLLAQHWLPGALGYLAGAGVGLVVGLALALPIVAASMALFAAPVGNIPGVLALLAGVTLGAVVLAAAETLIAPPVAALAWHFSKVPADPAAETR